MQTWGEDADCASKALGMLGWERRGMVPVRDLVGLGESRGSALGSLGVLGWGRPGYSGLKHFPWLERLRELVVRQLWGQPTVACTSL